MYAFTANSKHSEAIRSVFFEDLVVIRRNRGFIHDSHHHLRWSFAVTIESICTNSYNNTHSLEVRIELEPSEDFSFLPALRFEGKDDFWVGIWLIKSKLPKFKEFYLHGITYHFACSFNTYDRMVGGHVVVDVQKVRFALNNRCDVELVFISVIYCLVKFTFFCRYEGLKVHKILSQSASFIKAAEIYCSSSDNFVFLNAKNRLIIEFFNGIDNSKSHTNWQGRRHSNSDQIQEFHNHIHRIHNLHKMRNHPEVSHYCNQKQAGNKFCWLFLEDVLLLFGEKNYSNQLSLQGKKICSCNTHRNPECLPSWLKLGHFLLWIHLYNGCSFKNISGFIYSLLKIGVMVSDIGFLDNRHWLSSESTLVYESTSFKNNAFKG